MTTAPRLERGTYEHSNQYADFAVNRVFDLRAGFAAPVGATDVM